MAFASVIDWSLFCGLEICGLFASYTYKCLTSLSMGLPQQVFFFSSVCLLLSFKILQDCRNFLLHLCVQGALPTFSLSAFCLCFFVYFILLYFYFYFIFYFHILGYVFEM